MSSSDKKWEMGKRSVWLDNWHLLDPLCKRFGEILYDAASQMNAKMTEYVNRSG